MIRHTVVFRLKHLADSDAEHAFLAAAQSLAAIPGVTKFERLRQIGLKNEYRFGLSMEFADLEAYYRYDEHPLHEAFVQERWLPEVDSYMEIDYEAYAG